MISEFDKRIFENLLSVFSQNEEYLSSFDASNVIRATAMEFEQLESSFRESIRLVADELEMGLIDVSDARLALIGIFSNIDK